MTHKNYNFIIRTFDVSDIAKIVIRYSFPWSTPEKTKKIWDDYYREQQEGIRTVALLEKDGEILGYGSLLRRPECPFFSSKKIPEINAIWIDEHYRRQGLGTALIKWLENLASQEGHRQIGIGVGLYRDYGPAQQLYFQLGFIPEGNGVTYKGQPTVAGQSYPLDDDLLLWLVKVLTRGDAKSHHQIRLMSSELQKNEALDFRQRHFFDRINIQDPYRWALDHREHLHWLLYDDDKVIGYAHVQMWPDHRAALRIIIIDEQVRGHGLGRYLLSYCEQAMKEQGFKLLQTEASSKAYFFYKKLGYTEMPFNNPDGEPTHPDDRAMGKYL